jgi:hypothetical protein
VDGIVGLAGNCMGVDKRFHLYFLTNGRDSSGMRTTI